MLVKLLENGYGNEQQLNCAQKILYASNEVYNLNLTDDALTLSSGFGGGMGIESTCGALTAGVMVLSRLFPSKDEKSKNRLRSLTKELFDRYQENMGNIDCAPLKRDHRNDVIGCKNVILEAANVLDFIVQRELNK